MNGSRRRPLRILLVEDSKKRHALISAWLPPEVRLVWATSAGRALGMLERDDAETYDGIMLDHDLTEQRIASAEAVEGRFNGRHVAEKVVDRVSKDTPILVHSMNPSGGHAIVKTLEGADFTVTKVTMANLTKEVLAEWLVDVREIYAERTEA